MTARLRNIGVWAALGVLLGISARGFYHERLFEQPIWTPLGLERLLWLAAGCAVYSFVVCVLRPAWFVPLTLGLALLYTVGAVGVGAPVVALLVLLSSLLLGRRLLPRASREGAVDDLLALLLGLSLYMWAVGLAVHLRINYAPVYLAALAAPVLADLRTVAGYFRGAARLLRPAAPARRSEQALLALLAFVLIAHWLVVLKPEISADGLAVHLATPMTVAAGHRWAFDAAHLAWAVMPMGADWAFTLAYLPGGEFAARLLNLGVLLVIIALLFLAARRWAGTAAALLVSTLFAASPIVQLATGSLMAENIWAALLFGALIALWRCRETGDRRWLYLTAMLLGSALAVKFGALAFAVPVAVFAALELDRKRAVSSPLVPAVIALACFLFFAAPPYVTAWAKTGNPVFPFLNAVFKSPYFDATVSLTEKRFGAPLDWGTLYGITFQTGKYLESQNGGFGFHYLLLLPLALLLLGRTWPYAGWTALAVSAAFFFLTFPYQANARYLYPALAPLMVVIALALRALRPLGRSLYRAVFAVSLAAVFLNIYFLPASGWYHREFFLNALFDRGDVERYIEFHAPARKLIDHLNRRHPGEPVLFADGDPIAGLRAKAFTLTWHTDSFARRLRATASPTACLRLANELGVRYVIAPKPDSGIPVSHIPLQLFLTAFTEPEHRAGKYYVARVRDAYAGPSAWQRVKLEEPRLDPVAPGSYDDSSPSIWYSGAWTRDTQFPETFNRCVSYANGAGASFRFSFRGTRITYVYTKAFNRGIAEVTIDGASKGRLDLYSPDVRWQASTTFDGLGPGNHTLVVRVLPEHNPASSDSYVDADRLVVE